MLQQGRPASQTLASETVPALKLLTLAEDWCGPDLETSIALSEPRVMLQVVGQSLTFLLDMGAGYSFLTSHLGPTIFPPPPIFVIGLVGTLFFPLKALLLSSNLAGQFFSHSFPVIRCLPYTSAWSWYSQLLEGHVHLDHNNLSWVPLSSHFSNLKCSHPRLSCSYSTLSSRSPSMGNLHPFGCYSPPASPSLPYRPFFLPF